jgi:exosortase/archaeosortase family protein
MRLSRVNAFLLGITIAFLVPQAIPGVGLDYQYFFVLFLLLMCWFTFRWDRVKALAGRGSRPEMALGLIVIVADYAQNAWRASQVGMADLLVIFLAVAIVFFGLRSLRLFWVPAAYGALFLLGYRIEAHIPNYAALQDWLAGVMAWMLKGPGISSTASGDNVTMILPNGQPISLEITGECTGLQGIILFGLLSTLVLLFGKLRILRTIAIGAIGFAGAFLINIVRLLVIFLTFEYLGVDAGTYVHVYFGYSVFFAWVMTFWLLAQKYGVAPEGPTAAHTPQTLVDRKS